ncbi:hypothetical protein B0H11DRAFT_2141145 [Mycena galericulata]|nr:hypothetical protein B0H11DRAFT_2141145 [Mycena galericulata]
MRVRAFFKGFSLCLSFHLVFLIVASLLVPSHLPTIPRLPFLLPRFRVRCAHCRPSRTPPDTCRRTSTRRSAHVARHCYARDGCSRVEAPRS